MWEYIGAVGVVTGNDPQSGLPYKMQAAASHWQIQQTNNAYNQMLQQWERSAMPGGVVTFPAKAKDCEGCGAPLKAYIHHCEYCRRAK